MTENGDIDYLRTFEFGGQKIRLFPRYFPTNPITPD